MLALPIDSELPSSKEDDISKNQVGTGRVLGSRELMMRKKLCEEMRKVQYLWIKNRIQ